MTAMTSLKNRIVLTGAWFLENPVRVQLAIIGISMAAVAFMMVLGMSAGTSIAGPAGGGSGGSG